MEQIELNMLTIEKCLVCGSNQFEPFLVCKDQTVSKDNFNIVSCKMCGFKFTNPRPTDLVLGIFTLSPALNFAKYIGILSGKER